jgi:hypothetical protein
MLITLLNNTMICIIENVMLVVMAKVPRRQDVVGIA